MQATVASYADGSGTVVTDEGRILQFEPPALAEHIRHLRPGQRVHLDMDGDQISRLQLWR
jgi:hypothetical protein